MSNDFKLRLPTSYLHLSCYSTGQKLISVYLALLIALLTYYYLSLNVKAPLASTTFSRIFINQIVIISSRYSMH